MVRTKRQRTMQKIGKLNRTEFQYEQEIALLRAEYGALVLNGMRQKYLASPAAVQ